MFYSLAASSYRQHRETKRIAGVLPAVLDGSRDLPNAGARRHSVSNYCPLLNISLATCCGADMHLFAALSAIVIGVARAEQKASLDAFFFHDLPEYAAYIDIAELNKAYSVKLDCVDCPFVAASQDSQQDNALVCDKTRTNPASDTNNGSSCDSLSIANLSLNQNFYSMDASYFLLNLYTH
jgi:hypothetical protein